MLLEHFVGVMTAPRRDIPGRPQLEADPVALRRAIVALWWTRPELIDYLPPLPDYLALPPAEQAERLGRVSAALASLTPEALAALGARVDQVMAQAGAMV